MTPCPSHHSFFYHCELVSRSDFPVRKISLSLQCRKFKAALGHRTAPARQVFPDLPDRGAGLTPDPRPNLRA